MSIMATEIAPGGCGTYAAYQRHKRRGEPACQPCADAATNYQRAYRAKHAPGAVNEAIANRSRSRALWRLKDMHRDDFDLLVADELRVERNAARREGQNA